MRATSALSSARAPPVSLGAVGDARDQRLGVGSDLDHGVELQALLRQHRAQRIGLRHGAREAVEDEAVLAVGLVDALGDDAVDDLVGNQVAAIHDLLGREAHRRPGGDRRAQDIAGRELRNTELLDQDLGLRALADARRSEKDQPHRLRPPRRERFTSPSYCCAMRWLWIWLMVSSVTVTMMSSDVPPMNWLTLSWLWIISGMSATTVR